MNFSVMFWNIWLDNQVEGTKRYKEFVEELDILLQKYKPDFLVLNEVMKNKSHPFPLVLKHLKDRGFIHTYYCGDSPRSSDWTMGQAICSRKKASSIREIAISKNASAEKKGYKGHDKMAVVADFKLNDGTHFSLIATHLLYLRKHTIKQHYVGANNLKKLIEKDYSSCNALIVGDFNQPGFMPRSFKNATKHFLNQKTGTIGKSTWRNKAKKRTILRANLDQLYWSKNKDLKLDSFEVIDTDVSDHRPIFAKFNTEPR